MPYTRSQLLMGIIGRYYTKDDLERVHFGVVYV